MFEGLQKIVKLAEAEAQKAASLGEVPVAAVIFQDDFEVVAKAHNLVEARRDISAHAEMLAIKEAEQKYGGKYLNDLQIFVTLEPCAMCATAISYARLKRVFFAVQDVKFGAVVNGVRIYEQQPALFKPEIYPDISSNLSEKLLREFFVNKR